MDVTRVKLPYGHDVLSAEVPSANLQAILVPKQSGEESAPPSFPPIGGDERGGEVLREALVHPIGTPRLHDMVQPGQKVVIVTSDLTRPCPSERMLPPVLDELATAGIPDKDITVVIALGLHRAMTEAEINQAVGNDVYRRVRVINHDPNDTVRLGSTSAGTPVEIFRPVVEADSRVCLGNLELHYFAGYSGGAKAILPGCASRTAVNANHAMMVSPEAAAGRIAGNPLRADIEEGVALLGVDFILNVVVDGQHRIVGAVAGEVTAAHRQGCAMVAKRGIIEIDDPADLVLVSAGGYPKDVNLYQAQKALDNAAYAVRDGGILILVAECLEGLGNQTFEAWMTGASSPDDLLERIQQEFVLGGHKAAAVAAVLKRVQVYLVSALPDELVQRCGMVPFDNLTTALDAALDEMGPDAGVLVMPQGGSILPVVKE
ncbi:MAG: nickel-dependent lactate racemase [Chloroflexi bacterium]|nr:nickel-dependent lactate racemase [Chloroflexota bacterium]